MKVQVTIDYLDPRQLARFWSAVLGFSVQFDDPTNAWAAVVDPEGLGLGWTVWRTRHRPAGGGSS